MQFIDTLGIEIKFQTLISGTVSGYDSVWFIADKFMDQSFKQHLISARSEDGKLDYIKAHYNVFGFYDQSNLEELETTAEENLLLNLKRRLSKAINEHILLPKAIIIALHDNLLDYINHYEKGISVALGIALESLTNEFHSIINDYKQKLPSKARKYKYPTIFWVMIPQHIIYDQYNDFKEKFNIAVKKSVKNFREMETLVVKKWDKKETEYFTDGNFSELGFATYWHGINEAFEEWDRNMMRQNVSVSRQNNSNPRIAIANQLPTQERFQRNWHRERG